MTELRRDLTLSRGIAIVVGITIGTGVFLKSAPGYPVVPLVFALVMSGVLVSALIESPAEAAATLALLALGLPLYPLFRQRAQPAGQVS